MAFLSHNNQTPVVKFYSAIMDDVLAGVREAFLDEGVDEQVVQDLRQMWEAKVIASKVVDPPEVVEPPPSPIQLPEQFETPKTAQQKQSNGVNSQSQQVKQKLSTVINQPSTTKPYNPPQSNSVSSTTVVHDLNTKMVPIQLTLPAPVGSQDTQPRIISIQVPASALATNQLQRILTAPLIQAVMASPINVASTLLQQHVTATLQGQACSVQLDPNNSIGSEMHLDSGQETFPENSSNQAFSQMHHQQMSGNISQIDGTCNLSDDESWSRNSENDQSVSNVSDSLSIIALKDLPFQVDGIFDTSDDEDDDEEDDDMDDDDEEDEDNDDKVDENDEAENGVEEDPLNSEDDVSEGDNNDLFETENVVVCQFDKINRSRNKWKFYLKDGIMNLAGRDYIFQKANGDAEWKTSIMRVLPSLESTGSVDCFCFSSNEQLSICIKVIVESSDKLEIFAQKYLEYLVSLMRQNKPIDFIQAALVMQTLSSVFAKKVDHLQEQILAFTIVFRKLELGAQSENEDGSENNDGPERGKAVRKKNTDKENILHVFENICTATNIRKSCIKKWTEKDIKKVDPYSIRNKINECPKLKTKEIFSCYIYDSKLDNLGKKEEFGCNGIMCDDLIPKDNFCLSCSHSWNLSSYNETVNGSATAMDVEPPVEPPDIFQNEPEPLDVALPSPISHANEHSYQEVVEEFFNKSMDKDDSVSEHIYFERINRVQEALVDIGGIYDILWSPISDDNKLLERKIKKKNVKMSVDGDKTDENTSQSKTPYPTDYVLADLMLAVFKLKSNVPLHPHFSNSLRLEKEFRNKHINKKTGKRLKNVATNPKNADFRGFNEFGDDNIDNQDFEHEHDVLNDMMDPASDDANGPNNDDNYMQEAIQHIREYQQGFMQNQHDDTINEIAVKVSAWHDSIRPHLEREEGRTNFDIHEYGSKILQTFPANNAKTSLTFGECVQNEARDEIPRYFLSSLLLANSYNVEITKSNPDELSVNDMMLTLLSRVRQHELLDEGMRKEFS